MTKVLSILRYYNISGVGAFYRHARKHLVSLAEDMQMGELQHVMALLAFTPDTQLSPFKVTSYNSIISFHCTWYMNIIGFLYVLCTSPWTVELVVTGDVWRVTMEDAGWRVQGGELSSLPAQLDTYVHCRRTDGSLVSQDSVSLTFIVDEN